MTDCIFCKIGDKSAPAEIFFEDEVCLVIKNIHPISKGHTLVIPKVHAENILDIDGETFMHLSKTAQIIGKRLVNEHKADGLNVLHAAGKAVNNQSFISTFILYRDTREIIWIYGLEITYNLWSRVTK